MRGFKSEILLAIVDFLYTGEANVYQENLDSFLAIAEELRLKGLMGQTEDVDMKTEINHTIPTHGQMNPKPSYNREKSNLNTEPRQSNLEPKLDEQMNYEGRIVASTFLSGDLQELDEKVEVNDGNQPKPYSKW